MAAADAEEHPRVAIRLLRAGFCTQLQRLTIANGKWQQTQYHSVFAVIQHPKKGVCLFDTGYATHYFSETGGLPYSLFAKLIPVTLNPHDTASSQLAALGIAPEQVQFVFLSHFHADHISGLRDFPNARFVYHVQEYQSIAGKNPIACASCGVVPGLLPTDFVERSRVVPPGDPVVAGDGAKLVPLVTAREVDVSALIPPFRLGFDAFGDQSLICVPLPGHTAGHMGLLVAGEDGHDYFLVGDAVWSCAAFRELQPPSCVTRIIHHNWRAYKRTMRQLRDLHRIRPATRIIPAHCPEIVRRYTNENSNHGINIHPAALIIPTDRALRVLVTGATGFLGSHVTRRMLDLKFKVTATGRRMAAATRLGVAGARFVQADLCDADTVRRLCLTQDVVIHCAARCAPWGKYSDFYKDNVIATRNIVKACRVGHVQRLIHVSSPSVYFPSSVGDRFNVTELDPMPTAEQHETYYVRTKLMAEYEVDKGACAGLGTVILRPRGIFGPGDSTLFPRLLGKLAKGQLRVIGDGKQVMDLTHVTNVVHAIECAMQASPECLGKAYNITNGEPVRLWELVDQVATTLRIPLPSTRMHVPLAIARFAAALCESIWKLLRLIKLDYWEPPVTRYAVDAVGRSATLSIEAAKRELGYTPQLSMKEGMQQLLQSLNRAVLVAHQQSERSWRKWAPAFLPVVLALLWWLARQAPSSR